MAKIWCLSAPLYSHTDWGGFLNTAKALQQLGHEVLWISEKSLAEAIQHAGLDFHPVEKTGWLWPPPPPPDLTTIPPQEAVHLRYRRALDTWLSEDLVGEAVDCLLQLAEEIGKPDIILSDPFLSAAALVSEILGSAFVVMGWPAQSALDENALFPVQRALSSDSQIRLKTLLDRFQISGENFSQGTAPAIRSPLLHINYFTEDWYQAEAATLMPQNRFVGGTVGPLQSPVPDWLTDIPADQDLGLVTLGTIFTGDLGFFSWAAQAIAGAGLIPIVTVGWNPIPPDKKAELKRALPKGTRLVNFAPYEHLLPRSKIMIHHGGMGTTHAAIIHAVPQIVVPHAADQRIQGRRVAQAKVGLNLTAHDVKQGQLKEGVPAILAAGWVQENAQQLAQDMAAAGGVPRAAQLIDALIKI